MSRKHQLTAKCYDKRGRLLSQAQNSYTRSHPLQAHFAQLVGRPDAIYLHAEIAAILKASGKSIHKITIERYHLDGTPALARPCTICMRAIKAFSINKVEFTND